MRILRRNAADSERGPQAEAGPGLEAETSEFLNPSEFVAANRKSLNKSKEDWDTIGSDLSLACEPMPDIIHSGIVALHQGHNHAMPSVEDGTIQRAAADTTAYAWLTTRYYSSEDLQIRDSLGRVRDFYGDWLGIPDDTVRTGLAASGSRLKELVGEQNKLSAKMTVAELYTAPLVEKFIQEYLGNIDALETFAELYTNGQADGDPLFKELRHIIAADWYNPNKKKSQLQTGLDKVTIDSDKYVGDFALQASDPEAHRKYRHLQALARFAILASDEEVTPENMADVIKRTFPHWNQVEGLLPLYEDFLSDEVKEVSALLDVISGPKSMHGIRITPSKLELEKVRNALHFPGEDIFAPDRLTKRKVRRQVSKTTGRVMIPNVAELDLSKQATQETQSKSRVLSLLKIMSGSPNSLTEVDISELAKEFKMDNDSSRRTDVPTMVDWLLKQTISPASKMIYRPPIQVGPYRSRFWRFAPNLAEGLKYDYNNRFLRIVYVLTPEALGIADICTHEDYNTRWG